MKFLNLLIKNFKRILSKNLLSNKYLAILCLNKNNITLSIEHF